MENSLKIHKQRWTVRALFCSIELGPKKNYMSIHPYKDDLRTLGLLSLSVSHWWWVVTSHSPCQSMEVESGRKPDNKGRFLSVTYTPKVTGSVSWRKVYCALLCTWGVVQYTCVSTERWIGSVRCSRQRSDTPYRWDQHHLTGVPRVVHITW